MSDKPDKPYDWEYLTATEKVFEKFVNDPNFRQDRKEFASQPNVNVSRSVYLEPDDLIDECVSLFISASWYGY